MGRHPILVMRSTEGKVGAFLNTCRHRGTIVCPFKQGRQKFHVCRYHGWAYDSGGRNVSVTEEASGQYPPSFSNSNHDLLPVARLGSYRGFLFASLSADVPRWRNFSATPARSSTSSSIRATAVRSNSCRAPAPTRSMETGSCSSRTVSTTITSRPRTAPTSTS
ncbi:Rieske 2Fe-2S domain-containing protein [Bradyrhizobium sp. BR 1433]|uniref:Rieske 2Fe-2S domain-containing protein n=1 Tax=Bradyrhizobium sp. BR 1433 TaxID=3447967 RepID=UPI003EE6E7FC